MSERIIGYQQRRDGEWLTVLEVTEAGQPTRWRLISPVGSLVAVEWCDTRPHVDQPAKKESEAHS